MNRLSAIAIIIIPLYSWPQEKIVPIKYGDMDQWETRKIHESNIIGGKYKLLYEIGPARNIETNNPYKNLGDSPWGTSNVMAKVAGITKTNTTVYKETRDKGYCARLETHIESVKELGIVYIRVLATGSLFLGDMQEPITGTSDAEKYINCGIPFTQRPRAVCYDYKVKVSNAGDRIRLTGFSKKGQVEGRDCAIVVFFLQKRTEDIYGNITAKRVGTMVAKYDKNSNDWINGAMYEILYGNITRHSSYVSEIMGLRTGDYARNSKGESVPIKEIGWAAADEIPTHMMLQFSSSHGGPFIGSPGNTLWIDNVKLVY